MATNQQKLAARQAARDIVTARETKRAERSAADQIAELDRRLGDGVGATKERKRLAKQL